ncbi:hypothetical protein V6N13_013086 [Hibiscus sabdariffa]
MAAEERDHESIQNEDMNMEILKTRHGNRILRGKRGDQDAKGSDEIVSLYVENLTEQLHWMGLWNSFAKHRDVVNVYIARKRSRWGEIRIR